MTSTQNFRELFAGILLTSNIKYCPKTNYRKKWKIIDFKTIVSLSFLPQYNYSLQIYPHSYINHTFEDKQPKRGINADYIYPS